MKVFVCVWLCGCLLFFVLCVWLCGCMLFFVLCVCVCVFVAVISVRAVANRACPKFARAQEDYSKELSLQLSSHTTQQEKLAF